MKDRFLGAVMPAIVGVAGIASIALLLKTGPAEDIELRLPAAGGVTATAAQSPADIKGFFVAGEGKPADDSGAWPRFRGAGFDAISGETIRLARDWPAEGPPVLWSTALGEGYAGAAVLGGRVYVLDYDQTQKADTLRCLSLADGKEIWRRGYHVRVKRNHGMSRTVPAVTDDCVVTIGPMCQVLCADAKTGDYRWGIDLVAQYGTTVPDWYTGQCPLIDNGRAIVAPGGSALMIAVDCRTGQVAWKTPNPHQWLMTHSSIVPMTLGGTRMYVYCASGGVVGVSRETGEILWSTSAWTVNMANCPSPVPIGDGRIFLTGGYAAGSAMIRIDQKEKTFSVAEIFRLPPEVFGSEQHTPILYKDHLYGIRENGDMVCLDLNGKVAWTSGAPHRFGPKGRGPFLIADGMILAMDDNGTLALVDASSNGFTLLAQKRVAAGESWAPMALAGGRLILRDLTRMLCLDMRG